MIIESDRDFPALRNKINSWKQQFPMFKHDVYEIENVIEKHIQNYSIALVNFRQSKKKCFIDRAQLEIDQINELINLIEKIELMALLSRG